MWTHASLRLMTNHLVRTCQIWPNRSLLFFAFFSPVALNYQTGGEAMQLNHGRFLDNGGCGYVLKPNFLVAEEMFGILNGTVARNLRKMLKLTVSGSSFF